MKRRFTSVLVVCVITTMVYGLTTTIASASGQSISVSCEQNFGSKVPILMVHGFNSNPDTWSNADRSMQTVIKGIDDTHVVRPFDYKDARFDWVTNPLIGPQLAATIDCLSQASLKGGGTGKVVGIGHSMGGLALEDAASRSVDGRKIADELEHVISIGTPYAGSLLGNASTEAALSICRAPVAMLSPLLLPLVTKENCTGNLATTGLSVGSDELKKLPPFPANVSVRAIAGNVTLVAPFFNTKIITTSSDLVVGVDSATKQSTDSGKGDGKKVVDCEGTIPLAIFSDASCSHNNMLNTDNVQQLVKQGVEEYVASTKGTEYSFYGLTVQAGPKWSPEGESGLRVASTCMTKDTDGRSIRCSEVIFADPQDGFFFDVLPADVEWGVYSCPFGSERDGPDDAIDANVVHAKGTRMIGGLQADYYEVDRCTANYPRAYLRVWKVPAKRYAIMAFERVGAELTELDDMLKNATWK